MTKSNNSHFGPVTTFSSRGTRSTQPPFSDLNRNAFLTLDLNGSPFFTGTEPLKADQKYDYNRFAIAPTEYFADNLFEAYEYYRVKKIETEFIWATSPADGLITGQLYTAVDKDSRDPEPSDDYINRTNLAKREFTNHSPSHKIEYTPYLVDREDTEEQDYVQPTGRWWNTDNVRGHRWGCLRYMLVTQASAERYPGHYAKVFVQHRIVIEFCGLKNPVTPSLAPTLRDFGKQLTETCSPDGVTVGESGDVVDITSRENLQGHEQSNSLGSHRSTQPIVSLPKCMVEQSRMPPSRPVRRGRGGRRGQ